MYCKHCGNQIDNNSSFCSLCGKKILETNNETSTQPYQTMETTNIKKENPAQSISIIGFILSFFISIAGLIVSAVALKKYSSQENQEGRGLAVAGLVISIISLTVAVFYFLFIIAVLAVL